MNYKFKINFETKKNKNMSVDQSNYKLSINPHNRGQALQLGVDDDFTINVNGNKVFVSDDLNSLINEDKQSDNTIISRLYSQILQDCTFESFVAKVRRFELEEIFGDVSLIDEMIQNIDNTHNEFDEIQITPYPLTMTVNGKNYRVVPERIIQAVIEVIKNHRAKAVLCEEF